MAALFTEGAIGAVRVLTASADKLGLKTLAAFLAVLGVVAIVSSTLRALHKECPPGKPQCMTARQECQASSDLMK
jgi:hypothetical protein